MSISPSSSMTYPGHDYSLPQLLYAAKRKLQDAAFGGRVATTANQSEVDGLERDALEVLSLVRSFKNSFAPINRIPPDVLWLIPDHFDGLRSIQNKITLTHVCRGWRDMFISRSSLWTELSCRDVDKTRTFIKRSRSSPLYVFLMRHKTMKNFHDDAFPLLIPHIHRFKSLRVGTEVPPDFLKQFFFHAPLLDDLCIQADCPQAPTLDRALFGGDLSSLRCLELGGIVTQLPWRKMENLRTFNLDSPPPGQDITQLLDFLESAPLLAFVSLTDSIPTASSAPPNRLVHLPHLFKLLISSDMPHPTLLNHLCIPAGAGMGQRYTFSGRRSPLLIYLPESFANLGNLAHITAINILFDSTDKPMRLRGPSGELCMFPEYEGRDSNAMDSQILGSLSPQILSTTQRLVLSEYTYVNLVEAEKCPVIRTLSLTNELRTLVLIKCTNLSFILALDPEENPSNLVFCPKLEDVTLYIRPQDFFHSGHLVRMAKNRASRGAGLLSITIVGLGELVPGKEVFELRKYVKRVECRIEDEPPLRDDRSDWGDEDEDEDRDDEGDGD